MSAKIIPWPSRLPEQPAKIAATFGDIVTAMENHRPAFLKLASLDVRDTRRRYVVGEIRNIAYELRILARAFGIDEETLRCTECIYRPRETEQ